MLSEVLTFIFFVLIGLEIRQGLKRPKEILFPALCALSGMVFPALIFWALHRHSSAWAVAMPTDVALAIGAISILGKKVNPAIRLFILTLAIADDLFSLFVIGIFFRSHLNLGSSVYTLGAAAIGIFLPFSALLIRVLAPLTTFVIIPLYIGINLLWHLDFSQSASAISVTLIIARVVGKVVGISLAAWALSRWTPLKLPKELSLREIIGVGLLAGMGLTVSIVIAKITLGTATELSQVRIGLFFAAIISGVCGLLWIRFAGAPRQD